MRCQGVFLSFLKPKESVRARRQSGPHKRLTISLTLWGGSGFSLLPVKWGRGNTVFREATSTASRFCFTHSSWCTGVEPKASSKPGKFYALSPPFCFYSKTAFLSCHIDLEPAVFLPGSPNYLGQQSKTQLGLEKDQDVQNGRVPVYSILHVDLPGISPPLFSVCHRPHPSSSVMPLVRWDLQVHSPQFQKN